MKKNKLNILIIFIFSILFILINKTYYIGDDSLFHTSNIISLSKIHTIIPNKILPILLNNLGYGVNIFYPPLPHILGSILYKITNNINITIKLLQFLSIFLSGITMYYYIDTIFKKKETSLITSLFYISMPYLFTDVFTRAALNESFLFYILPLIFLSFHYLYLKNNKLFYLFFILSFSLCIYTHLVLTIYITIISLIYLLIFYKELLTKKNIIKLLKSTILVLCITSPFWLPLIEHYFLKDYTIFLIDYTKENAVTTLPLYYYFFPIKLLSGARNPLRFNINPIALLFIVLTYLTFYEKKEEKNTSKILLAFLIITIITILLESLNSIWNIIPNILRNIQFSWRLSLITSFTSAIIAGYGINILKNKKVLLTITIVLLLSINIYHIKTLPPQESNTNIIDSSCCKYNWQQEYLPKNASVNIDYLSHREKNSIISSDKSAIITIKKINNKNIIFNIKNITKETTLELPRIYYLGYELTINNKKINIIQNKKGLIEAKIKKEGTYKLSYNSTFLYRLSILISILGIILSLKFIIKNNDFK